MSYFLLQNRKSTYFRISFTVCRSVFCQSGLHVFDFFVVATSLALEVVFHNDPEGGLLVLARIW